MNKFYVTKEIAEKLRAKGYDVEEIVYETSLLNIDEVYFSSPCRMYKLPRIDEVLSWLRDEKNISVEVLSTSYGWYADIRNAGNILKNDISGGSQIKEVFGNNDGGRFNTHYEATLAGIEYVLDNLI